MSTMINSSSPGMLEMNNNLTMVNPVAVLPAAGNKDSKWLTLEVCREFLRSKCSRSDLECKFAHPPPHVEVQNGRVMCCFDSIKGKCQRKDPPCKYLHPPQHLREQLIQNGRHNLMVKQYQHQALGLLHHPAIFHNNGPTVIYDTSAAKTISYAAPGLVHGQAYPTANVMAPQFIIPSTMQSINASYITQGMVPVPYGSAGLYATQTAAQTMDNGNSVSPSAAQMAGLMAVSSANGQSQKMQRAETNGNNNEVTYTAVSGAGDSNTQTSSAAAIAAANAYGTTMYAYPHQGMPHILPMIKRPALTDKTGMPMYPQALYQAQGLGHLQLAPAAQFMPVTSRCPKAMCMAHHGVGDSSLCHPTHQSFQDMSVYARPGHMGEGDGPRQHKATMMPDGSGMAHYVPVAYGMQWNKPSFMSTSFCGHPSKSMHEEWLGSQPNMHPTKMMAPAPGVQFLPEPFYYGGIPWSNGGNTKIHNVTWSSTLEK